MSVPVPQPAGWDPHQPQPKKKRSPAQTIIIVAVIILVVCGGIGATASYFIYRALNGATAPMRDAAAGYLDDLLTHDYQTAYGRLCHRVQERYTKDQFVATVSANPITAYRVTGLRVDNRSGLVDGTVTVTVTDSMGQHTKTIPMLGSGDEWQVCGDPD